MKKQQQKIILTTKEWDYTCRDGCCYTWGTDLFLNGERITQHLENQPMAETVKEVLEHLGYSDVEIEW